MRVPISKINPQLALFLLVRNIDNKVTNTERMTLFGLGSHVTEEYEPCLIKKNNIKNVFHLSLTCFQNRSRPLQQESVETQLLLSTGGANINTKGEGSL